MSEKIISSHIFMFPFTWESGNSKTFFRRIRKISPLSQFEEILIKDGKWEEKILNQEKWWERAESEQEYNEYVYFYESVRDALYNEKKDGSLLRNFLYKDVDKTKKSRYIISIFEEKKDESKEDKPKEYELEEYELQLNKIILKIYGTGIGILQYYLHNTKYEKWEDICKINDYGRRIYPQFLPIEQCKGAFLADSLEIVFKDKSKIREDFTQKKYPYQISNTVQKLFGKGIVFGKKDNEKNEKNEKIYIQSAIDDRMYTMCWYMNDIDSQVLTQKVNYSQIGEMSYEYENNERWYEYMFVDHNEPTCKHQEMLKRLIREHTYERWAKNNTLYGITRYSLVGIGNNSDFSKDIIRIQCETMYAQLAILALQQRASILNFSNKVAKISKEKDEKKLEKQTANLYREYIQFINQLTFREVTAQEQGIEMYNMIVKHMSIDRDLKQLDEEIDELHQFATATNERRVNQSINLLTWLGGILLVPTFITGFLGMNIFGTEKIFGWCWLIWCLIILGFIVACPIIIKVYKKLQS